MSQGLAGNIILIGDGSVGKTCILLQFVEKYFTLNTTMTVGIEFKKKNIEVDGDEVPIVVWDTAGQEKYKALPPNFYKRAQGIMVVFDLTNPESFKNVQSWLKQIKVNTEEDVPIMFLGNKYDMEDKREVSQEDINNLSKETGFPYLECSAKSGKNINKAFEQMARKIKNSMGDTLGKKPKDTVSLSRDTVITPPPSNGGCKC